MNVTMFKILQRLQASADYVSGELISESLDISRTAVWKHVNNLRREGYDIASSPRLGYKLVDVPDVVHPWEVKRGLNTRVFGCEVLHFDELESTNDTAKALARDGAAEGTLVIAEEQTRGRGRWGRRWISPGRGAGLWFSIVLRPGFPLQYVTAFTLVAAVGIRRGLESVLGMAPGIKWPNDLVVNGRKLAGILVEVAAEADRIQHLILGTGINVNLSARRFPDEIRDIATSISEWTGHECRRLPLLRGLLVQMEAVYMELGRGSWDVLLDECRRHCVTLGKRVRLVQGEEEITGWASNIAPDGGLIITGSGGGERTFYCGDVSVVTGDHLV